MASTEYMQEWIERPGNRERKREANRRYYARAKAEGKVTKYNRERARFRKHGTTLQDFEALIQQQGGACAVCGVAGTWESLMVDHDHSCCPGQFSCGGCVRGALCTSCNTAIGLLQESPDLVESALSYLKSER